MVGRVEGLRILAETTSADERVLTVEAMAFVAELVRRFRPRVHALLEAREERQRGYDLGVAPQFDPDTAEIRESDWTVAPLPEALLDRRVEITGPVERKMVINAMNSGARMFMADFEDSTSPTWRNVIDGQTNLRDAVSGSITFHDAAKDKNYALRERPATLLVRPRGWHLWEKHVDVDGEPVPAALFDFGLFLFHNARPLLSQGKGPYFYLPKLQGYLEARLWNDVFVFAQERLDLPLGTIKATVLIETLPAVFEMDEILYELRDHSAGLNCGRWDYIFSFIKTFRSDPSRVVPDRSAVGMTQPFMRAYTQLLIKTCHRREVHAMGGMAAQIPIKDDADANSAAIDKVRADKRREAEDGHDGTWVAHPGLVSVAMEIFDEVLGDAPNQIAKKREDVQVSAEQLVEAPRGERTESGLRVNVNVGILYLEAWLRGNGCVPLYHLMEDAATAEISRSQIWQWIHHGVDIAGSTLTVERLQGIVDEELSTIREQVGAERFEQGAFHRAAELFVNLSTAEQLESFLTLPAYEQIVEKR